MKSLKHFNFILFTTLILSCSSNPKWTTIETKGTCAARHECGFVAHNDALYLIGGRGEKPVDKFNTITNTWSALKNTPIEMNHITPVSVNGSIYIVTGLTGNYPKETPLTHVYKFNPEQDTWEIIFEIPEDRRRGGAGVTVYNNKIYVSNGIIDGHTSGTCNLFDVYNPSENTWESLPNTPTKRDHSSAVVIDDLLIEQNVNVLIKVNTSTPLYAQLFSVHTSINEFSPLIEDTEVYLLSPTRNKIDVIERGKLPVSTHLDNETKKEITLSLNSDFSSITISSVNSHKGHSKKDEQYDRLTFTDYVEEDYAKYDTESFIDLVKRKKDKIRYKKELDALAEKIKAKQKETFENNAKAEYRVTEVEDYTYKINATGRYGLDTYFTFTESFNAKNALLKKAGPNYIIEIGKLIGGQIDLEEKERNRTANVYVQNARSFNHNITFNIPEGYTVAGLDKLNKSVDNETGAFISTAVIEGDQLIINTSKQYKHNFEPNSNWNKMIAFLDEANQFTNEKILLKKK